MSECVVRMEMPICCHDCPFEADQWDYPICRVTGRSEGYRFDARNNRMVDCPIVCSLPEGHGRLVDANAYSAEMKDRQEAAWKWRNKAIADEDEVKLARAEGAFTAFVEAKLTWDKQATIVPAERSET